MYEGPAAQADESRRRSLSVWIASSSNAARSSYMVGDTKIAISATDKKLVNFSEK
jgi:hypothetical protein